jgi:hypothetical protein
LDLHGYVGKYLKIQVELMDTYRTVHKVHSTTQIFIRPEFYGSHIESKVADSKAEPKEEEKELAGFSISKPDKKNFLSTMTLNGI